MSLASSWALVGLLALPVAWWWHRRRRRPPVLDLPSLLFLRPEVEAPPARRAVLDPELLLVLGALLLLTLAAAGPGLTRRAAGRTVRVVVSRGVPAAARGYAERVEGVLDRLRSALGPDDVLEVVDEPAGGTGTESRPSEEALLGAAYAGRAARRLVVSDHPVTEEVYGLDWVAVGDEEAFNVGIVAAALVPSGAAYEVFVNVQGDERRDVEARLVLIAGREEVSETALVLPAGSSASHTFSLSGAGLAVSVELRAAGGAPWADDLAADDRVGWRRDTLRLHLDEALPRAHRRAMEDALLAALGRGGFVRVASDAALHVAPSSAGGNASDAAWRLVLHPAAEGGATRAGDGADRLRADPLVRDLSTAGVDLVFAPDALGVDETLTLLLWREEGGRRWPVVARRGREVHFLPDPTRGRPAPADSPLWPLFVDDLLGQVVGRSTGAAGGYRLLGAWGPETSRLGATTSALPDLDLATQSADRPARLFSLRPFLVLAALVLLVLAWAVPRSAPGRASRAAPQAVPSTS